MFFSVIAEYKSLVGLRKDDNHTLLSSSSLSFFSLPTLYWSSFLFSPSPSVPCTPVRWPSVMRTPPWCSWRKSSGLTRLWGENMTLRSSTSPWRLACEFHLSSGPLCCTETWSTSHTCSPLLTRYQHDCLLRLQRSFLIYSLLKLFFSLKDSLSSSMFCPSYSLQSHLQRASRSWQSFCRGQETLPTSRALDHT